jgi:hypothetical protein
MAKPTPKKAPTGRTKLRLNPESKARAPFMILLSKEEKAQFTERADDVGLPLGTWMRMICLREVRAAEENR